MQYDIVKNTLHRIAFSEHLPVGEEGGRPVIIVNKKLKHGNSIKTVKSLWQDKNTGFRFTPDQNTDNYNNKRNKTE